MKVTKLGHCCLLLEVNGKRILTDPGIFTVEQHSALKNIDIIIITHEHGDHLHTQSLQSVLENNPQATVVSNSSVKSILKDWGIECEVCEGKAKNQYKDILIQATGGEHAEIYEERGQVPTVSYYINQQLFLPGDSYEIPEHAVEILALPIAGPWCRIADAIKFALAISPQYAFPVHDALLSKAGWEVTVKHPQTVLTEAGSKFISLRDGEEYNF